MTTSTIIRVTYYRAGSEWSYAAWTDEGYDHSDTIGVDDAASDGEARSEMGRQFPGATIERVPDVTPDGRPTEG